MLPKTSAYVRSYDGQAKWMYLKPKLNIMMKILICKCFQKCFQVFSKVFCKCIEENETRHINDNLSDFSSSDESNEK